MVKESTRECDRMQEPEPFQPGIERIDIANTYPVAAAVSELRSWRRGCLAHLLGQGRSEQKEALLTH